MYKSGLVPGDKVTIADCCPVRACYQVMTMTVEIAPWDGDGREITKLFECPTGIPTEMLTKKEAQNELPEDVQT